MNLALEGFVVVGWDVLVVFDLINATAPHIYNFLQRQIRSGFSCPRRFFIVQ